MKVYTRAMPRPLVHLSIALLIGCAGTGQQSSTTPDRDPGGKPTGYVLGRDGMPRNHFLTSVSLLLSQRICSDSAVRACYAQLDDRTCVRLVGDAVVAADSFDLRPISGPAQLTWMRGRGKAAAVGALAAVPGLTPCGAEAPQVVLQTKAIGNAMGTGAPCIRLQQDDTPCDAAPGSQSPHHFN